MPSFGGSAAEAGASWAVETVANAYSSVARIKDRVTGIPSSQCLATLDDTSVGEIVPLPQGCPARRRNISAWIIAAIGGAEPRRESSAAEGRRWLLR